MNSRYEIRGEVTAIFINSKKYGPMETLISTNKLQKANEFPGSWYASFNKSTKTFYVQGNMPVTNGKQKTVLLHRWISNSPTGMVVDHFNRDTMDNTDSNLRVITQGENSQNRSASRKNGTGIRNVRRSTNAGKWEAQIKVKGKYIYLGIFDDIEEAEKTAIEARKKYMPYSQDATA